MNGKNPYQELIERTRTWIFDLPDSDLLMPILELRFTPEEAEFLSGFPYMPHTLDQLTQRLKESQEKLLQINGANDTKGRDMRNRGQERGSILTHGPYTVLVPNAGLERRG